MENGGGEGLGQGLWKEGCRAKLEESEGTRTLCLAEALELGPVDLWGSLESLNTW